MDDKEQAAIDALRAAGLEAEACAVEALRARHTTTMDAFHAGQRASYKAGQEAERAAKSHPLSDEQIERGREAAFSTCNPFCPCDSKTMRKAVRWAEHAHGIGA